MGDDASPVAMPAPAVTVNRKSGAQLALALTVFALVLASNSIINESWLTASQEVGDVELTTDYSLTEVAFEITGTGEEEVESYDDLYNDCKDIDGEEAEEECAKVKDYHNAGYVAIILLIVSSVILLVASVMQVRSMIGASQRASNLISAIGGGFVGISILVWWIMLPESDLERNWGQGLWMVLISATCGLIAGFSGVLQSWIDGPPRMRAHGVRSGSGMNEFVLKESSCGNHTLSILVDSDLIRVAKIDRIGASASTKDILATRRDSYTGFSHQRMDWLDDFKGVWWVVGGASLISSFMISILFLIPFILASALALFQLMDPERFVISTNSGNHPFYINRWRSNRELTNLAMDLVDDAMIDVLRGEELETELLDARADLIAERFSANREAEQIAIAEAAAEKEAFIQAAEVSSEAPVESEEPPAPQVEAPAPVAETSDSPVTEPTPKAVETVEETPSLSDEVEWPEQTPDASEAESETEAAEQKEPPAPQVEAPVPVAEPPVVETPAAEPPITIPPPPPLPAAPSPMPPAIMPPPPLPAAPSPTPPAIIPPPPLPTAMPAPPGMSSMPPPPGMPGMPPPPAGATMMPPMAENQPLPTPPPVLVQAAPREDNLSDDEMDDLLGDLSS